MITTAVAARRAFPFAFYFGFRFSARPVWSDLMLVLASVWLLSVLGLAEMAARAPDRDDLSAEDEAP